MENVIIETVAAIVATLFTMLIGVLGTWLTSKIGKRQELQTINLAIDEATRAAQTTVLELQQTVVDGLKSGSADGKLTQEEIAELGNLLVHNTVEKMSAPTKTILDAAGVDITAIIRSAGEAMIASMKMNT